MDEQVFYKIMQKHPEGYKTLFHGLNGSKLLPVEKWLRAEEKMGRDGSGPKWYLTGWHVLPDVETCEQYLRQFRHQEDKVFVPCLAAEMRRKEGARAEVYLARWMKLLGCSYPKN